MPPRPLEELAAAAATHCELLAREVIGLLVHQTIDPEVAAAEFHLPVAFPAAAERWRVSSFVCER